MLRCGFTSFEVINAPTLRALEEGRLPHLVLAYQPGLAPGEQPAGTRPWLRRAAGELATEIYATVTVTGGATHHRLCPTTRQT